MSSLSTPRTGVLSGVYTALFTPLRDDDSRRLRNSVDFDKAASMIEAQIAGDVAGIIPIGTTGQSPTVTPDQHLEFIRFVIRTIDGRAQVIAGAGSNCTRESVDMIGAIQKIAPGTPCLCVTGYYNNPPQQGLLDHFQTITAETGAPLVLYNVPSRTSSYLEPETIVELAHNPLIIGLKQAVDFVSAGKYREDTFRVIRETAGLNFSVVSGEDDYLAELLSMGGSGIISATANIPEALRLYLDLVEAFKAGNPTKGRELQAQVSQFTRWVFARKNPIPLATLFASPVFLPLVDMARTPNGAADVEEMLAWAKTHAPSLAAWGAIR